MTRKQHNEIKIVVVRVGKQPEEMVIKNELEAMQRIVDGYIEVVPMPNDLLMVCDEEGKLKGKPANVKAMGDYIVGDTFITKAAPDGEFVSLNESEIDLLKNLFAVTEPNEEDF